MSQMVEIRSVKQIFKEYVADPWQEKGKLDKVDLISIKQTLLNVFKREVFGQIYFKLGDKAKTMTRDELANLDGIHNILVQSLRKWKRLCILCSEAGLGNFLSLDDLERILTEEEPDPDIIEEITSKVEEDVTDKLNEILPEGEKPVYLEEAKQDA